MYKERLSSLLKVNSIDINSVDEILYKTLVHCAFVIVCRSLSNDNNNKRIERDKFRNSSYKYKTTMQLVDKYVGCKFNEDDYSLLHSLLKAYFSKSNNRKRFERKFKQSLINKQMEVCPICGDDISISNSHLDHIVPWIYVGDEITDNYQMLCSSCNTKKGSSLNYELIMLLMNKRVQKTV